MAKKGKGKKGKKTNGVEAKQVLQNEQLLEAAQGLAEQNERLIGAIMLSVEASEGKKGKKGKKRKSSSDAKNRVLSMRKMYESEEHVTGQDKPRVMKSTGPARESLDQVEIELVDRPISQGKLEELAFNEEMITVIVHETGNDADPPLPQFTNDGKNQFFIRGEEQTVKRKFVEQLAGCKKTTYTHQKTQDAEGNDTYVYHGHTTLAYPFLVINDPNPRGSAWLSAIQQRD